MEAESGGGVLRSIDHKVFHKSMACLEVGEKGGKGGSDGEDEVEGRGDVGGAMQELEFQRQEGNYGLDGWWWGQGSTGGRGHKWRWKCGFGALLLFGARAGRLLFLGRHLWEWARRSVCFGE